MIKKLRSEKANNGNAELYLISTSTEELQLFRVGVLIPFKASDEKIFKNQEDAEIEYDKSLDNFHETFDGWVY